MKRLLFFALLLTACQETQKGGADVEDTTGKPQVTNLPSIEEDVSDTAKRTTPQADTTAQHTDTLTLSQPREEGAIPPIPRPPDTLRGLYVNRWAALGKRMYKLINLAKRTEVNALVIDVKDDRGLVLYPSTVPLAKAIKADQGHVTKRSHIKALLDSMQAHGIFTIARIVVAKDDLLAKNKTEWTIRKKNDTSQPWLDRRGRHWLDPHQFGIWQYALDLSREALELGFDEIQFDYMRFPDQHGMASAVAYPLANERSRSKVIGQQIDSCRRVINRWGARLTGDVFGLTTTNRTDMGIGQYWETFVDKLDVVLPMTYPSHYYKGSYGLNHPNAQPYKTIFSALRDGKARSAKIKNAAVIIPWYQDFTLGAPRYGPHEVREQMRAGYDQGIYSWVLWNPRSEYTEAALRRE